MSKPLPPILLAALLVAFLLFGVRLFNHSQPVRVQFVDGFNLATTTKMDRSLANVLQADPAWTYLDPGKRHYSTRDPDGRLLEEGTLEVPGTSGKYVVNVLGSAPLVRITTTYVRPGATAPPPKVEILDEPGRLYGADYVFEPAPEEFTPSWRNGWKTTITEIRQPLGDWHRQAALLESQGLMKQRAQLLARLSAANADNYAWLEQLEEVDRKSGPGAAALLAKTSAAVHHNPWLAFMALRFQLRAGESATFESELRERMKENPSSQLTYLYLRTRPVPTSGPEMPLSDEMHAVDEVWHGQYEEGVKRFASMRTHSSEFVSLYLYALLRTGRPRLAQDVYRFESQQGTSKVVDRGLHSVLPDLRSPRQFDPEFAVGLSSLASELDRKSPLTSDEAAAIRLIHDAPSIYESWTDSMLGLTDETVENLPEEMVLLMVGKAIHDGNVAATEELLRKSPGLMLSAKDATAFVLHNQWSPAIQALSPHARAGLLLAQFRVKLAQGSYDEELYRTLVTEPFDDELSQACHRALTSSERHPEANPLHVPEPQPVEYRLR